MGAGIYYVSKALQKNESAFTKPVIATIIELLVFVLFIINVIRGVSGYEELFSLYLVAITLAYALSGITYTARISWAPLEFLGRISLPIYCLHWGIYRWVSAAFGEKIDYVIAIVITYVLCLLSAVVIMYIVKTVNSKRKTK
jgi:peptidoglycan/LPS O-acetylase OafA/YrhL